MADLTVTAVVFEDLESPNERGEVIRARFTVQNLEHRAAPWRAFVGDVPVRIAVQVPGTEEVIGFLPERPEDGDTVFFGYADEEPVDTELTFPGDGNV